MSLNSRISIALVLALGLLFVGAVALVLDIFANVPDFTQMRSQVKVNIKLANGEKSTKMMGPKAPGWVPYSGVSKNLFSAVISSEDTSFYSHDGVDMHEIQEAIRKDWAEKRFARGASTLTQQVVKNVYLSNQKTLWRKIKEILWAKQMEKVLSKTEILTFYVNMAEWGRGIYGIRDASSYYFSASPSSLTPRQAAFLAMLLPSPRRYQSYFAAKTLTRWASNRVDRILHIMTRMGQLSPESYEVALNEKLWGAEVLSDDTPGVPSDPGMISDPTDDEALPLGLAINPTQDPPAAKPVLDTEPGSLEPKPEILVEEPSE